MGEGVGQIVIWIATIQYDASYGGRGFAEIVRIPSYGGKGVVDIHSFLA